MKNEIEYQKAAEYLKGRFEAELNHFATARNLFPQELARRVFVGEHSGNEEQLSDVTVLQVSGKRKAMRVPSESAGSGMAEVAQHGRTYSNSHRKPRKVAKWSAERRKAQGDMMRQRWAQGKFDSKRKPIDGDNQ